MGLMRSMVSGKLCRLLLVLLLAPATCFHLQQALIGSHLFGKRSISAGSLAGLTERLRVFRFRPGTLCVFTPLFQGVSRRRVVLEIEARGVVFVRTIAGVSQVLLLRSVRRALILHDLR